MSNDDKTLLSVSVLIAEDAKDIRLLMSRILSRYGAKVITAENGQDALDKAVAGPIDIVLMDLQMPIMDGYESAPLLRAGGYVGPIIALTGHSLDYAKSHENSFGFDGYLQKPVTTTDLVNTILEFCPSND
jgi:CheY-like chemotaxis protein